MLTDVSWSGMGHHGSYSSAAVSTASGRNAPGGEPADTEQQAGAVLPSLPFYIAAMRSSCSTCTASIEHKYLSLPPCSAALRASSSVSFQNAGVAPEALSACSRVSMKLKAVRKTAFSVCSVVHVPPLYCCCVMGVTVPPRWKATPRFVPVRLSIVT